jgi:uncharacterized protein with HEPN domain
MYDIELIKTILEQISNALGKISNRFLVIKSPTDFSDTPEGMEKLDSICMLFIAVGESLKNIDKLSSGDLLQKYPEIDWKGVIGFRDILSHHYFDIDAEQVFWICTNHLTPLAATIKMIIKEFETIEEEGESHQETSNNDSL